METIGIRCRHGGIRAVWIGVCAALSLPGCVKQAPPEVAATADTRVSQAGALNWARDALKRNPSLELIATDESAGVFTIRNKDTGEVHAVKANELAAVPVFALRTAQRNLPSESQTPVLPTATDQAPSPQPATAEPDQVAAATEASQSAATPNYTIERSDGQIKVSGPGISIVSSGVATVTPAEGATDQRGVDPIICEGRRMLHLNDRTIYVDGNAIIARGGCELFVTNSRISASGTGIVIGDATVHISNSTIAGNVASFDASDDAKVFVRSSTFEGLSRRAERAVVQDQGGNQWR
jgi:hypothetical protein